MALMSAAASPSFYNDGSTKQEIEIEQSDTVVICTLRTHRIGFGAIEFQSFYL